MSARVIEPALSQGTWVLCDRFFEFDARLSGQAGQVAPGVLNAMERVTIGDLKPDLTIILDVPVEIGLQRAAARRGTGAPDRFEAEDIKFHQDLRDAYRQIAADEPQRCVLIDANADAETVAAQVWTAFATICSPLRNAATPHERPQDRAGDRASGIRAKPQSCSGIARPRPRC